MDETAFIDRLRLREHEAFAELIRLYREPMLACCYSVGLNTTDAEDAASEAFLAAWEKIADFKGESKLSTWLLRIAYYKAVDCLRNRSREAQFEGAYQVSSRTGDKTDPADVIWLAVTALPIPLGTITILFYREDKSIAEIAKVLGMPQNTVKVYLHRARIILKVSLKAHIEEA